MSAVVTVYVTCPDREVARSLANAAIDEALAACANLLQAESIYDWEGERHQEHEVVMLLKTTREAAPRLVELIAAQHPFDVPCIEVIEVADAFPAYAAWVARSVK